jgi:hypothetical protein
MDARIVTARPDAPLEPAVLGGGYAATLGVSCHNLEGVSQQRRSECEESQALEASS